MRIAPRDSRARSTARFAVDAQPTTDGLHPFPHDAKSKMSGRNGQRVEAASVVGDGELHSVWFPDEAHLHALCVRMFDDVGERFLSDAIEDHLCLRCELALT